MKPLVQFWKQYRAPFMLFALVAFCLIAFRATLRPFLVAIFIAYLIDPVVAWVNQRTVRGRHVPRALAVLSVYAIVISVVTLFSAFVVPELTREVGHLAKDLPQNIEEFRQDKLPAVNERLSGFFRRPVGERILTSPEVQIAAARVHTQLDKAEERAFLAGFLPTKEERKRLVEGKTHVQSRATNQSLDQHIVRLQQEEGGDWLVLLEQEYIELTPTSDGAYRLQIPDPDPRNHVGRGEFDLGRMVDNMVDNLAQTTGKIFSDALVFGQRLLTKVSGLLFATLITLMVAAFLSIDVPHILAFFRSLFPEDKQEKLNTLLAQINRGLSGVIRGQLLICLVNGILTGIGLFIFKVKFAFVLAVFAGVMSLIPVFGTIISSVPCVLIALTGGVVPAAGVTIWIAIIHFLEGNILNPKIIGGAARIHPAIVVFALVAGQHVYGILGALLAVPIASLVQTLFLFFAEIPTKDDAKHDLDNDYGETILPAVSTSESDPIS